MFIIQYFSIKFKYIGRDIIELTGNRCVAWTPLGEVLGVIRLTPARVIVSGETTVVQVSNVPLNAMLSSESISGFKFSLSPASSVYNHTFIHIHLTDTKIR
jgi:hypothetical protein